MTQCSLIRGNNYAWTPNRLFINVPPNESLAICDTLDRDAFARNVIEPLYYQDVCADCIIYDSVNGFSVIRAVIEVFLRHCVPPSYSLDNIPFASEKLKHILRKNSDISFRLNALIPFTRNDRQSRDKIQINNFIKYYSSQSEF